METFRSGDMPKDITDRERSNSAGKSNSAGNRTAPRRANKSSLKETKHHMNMKSNRAKLQETKTGLRVKYLKGCTKARIFLVFFFRRFIFISFYLTTRSRPIRFVT